MSARLCEGRVAVVTGAGRGIGRAHALALAEAGAKVVVNDLGAAVDGDGASQAPADEVVDAIRAAGGEAVSNADDVSDWHGARRLVDAALDAFGRLDVLVNNAGILRDRLLVNMEEDEFDKVVAVHLKGTFATSRWAAAYWRQSAKDGVDNDARIINTSSGSGLYGNVGQSNYGAAKAGIASMTIIAAQELDRYGITVNAIAPGALTRMTENLTIGARAAEIPDGAFNPFLPENVSPLVVWLASPASRDITGRVFNVYGGSISVAEGWRVGPGVEQQRRWDPAELGDVVPDLVRQAAPASRMSA